MRCEQIAIALQQRTEQLRQSGASEQHNTSTIRSDNTAPLAADIWPDCTDPPKRLINWILPSDCDNATGLPSVYCYLNLISPWTAQNSVLAAWQLISSHCCHHSCLLFHSLNYSIVNEISFLTIHGFLQTFLHLLLNIKHQIRFIT